MGAEWKVVATSTDRFGAEMLVALLKEAGIPSVIQADDGGGWVPAMLQMKGVAVLVPADAVEAAESAIRPGGPLEEE